MCHKIRIPDLIRIKGDRSKENDNISCSAQYQADIFICHRDIMKKSLKGIFNVKIRTTLSFSTQGHPRSNPLVPNESPYMVSYLPIIVTKCLSIIVMEL